MNLDLMTIRQAHETYNVPIKTIENHYRLNNIDGLKVEGRVYVVGASVEKWKAENYTPEEPQRMFYNAEEALSLIADILNKTTKN